MPLYEYQCKKCGQVFEVMQKFSDEPLKKHAGCGGKVEKQMSAPAFHLKGSGWYVTDYGKGGVVPRNPTESESKAETKSESTSETKTETKAESSTDSTKSESKKTAKADSKPAASSSK